jgi:acetylornithine/N-succinyldiaminopimelate aminotransferase
MLTNRQLFLSHLGQTSHSPLMIEVEKADGVYLYSPEGRRYTDLISGVSVSNTGHCRKEVITAIKKQTESYLHLMVYGEFIQSPQVLYAKLLTDHLPDNLKVCYFVNSGSEAVEGAMKLSRRHTGRTKIIYFENAYHGSTLGALSIQGSEIYRSAFKPLLPDTIQARFNDFNSLNLIDSSTACVIVEPVQAEAGVIFPDSGFLEELRSRCTDNGALLVFDEIQTGFGRLGKMFAIDRFGVVPDILLLAKALGGGMPLGAFVASDEIMSSFTTKPPLGHITTFGGHPVCCAAGMASMQVLLGENIVSNCKSISDIFRNLLKSKAIKEIRGEGLLLAVETGTPELVQRIISRAPDYGLVLDYFLFCNTAFRIAPPLIISRKETEEACTALNQLIDDCANDQTF